jgi:uncharacterized protein involved in exopolysaccharide biosynthesis
MTETGVETLDISRLLGLLHARKTLVAGVTLVITLAALVYVLVMSPTYTAVGTIMPSFDSGSQPSPMGQMAGLAEGLGFSMGQLGPADNSELYRDILESRTIIYPLMRESFLSPENGERRTVMDSFPAEPDETSNARLQRVYKEILKRLTVVKESRTGMVTLELDWDSNWMSAAVVNHMMYALDVFIQERTSQLARNNREYIATQMSAARDSLYRAEADLLLHRQQNRRIENSPSLQQERERFELEKQIRQESFIVLKREHELAKLEEQKNIGVLNILDNAEIPAIRSGPRRLYIMIASLAAGFFLGILWAVIAAYWPSYKRVVA